MRWFTDFINIVFSLGLIINAILFIPQAMRIYKMKNAADVSLTTFIGFCLIQLSAILYGALHKDYILMYGYIFAFITCSSVVCLSIYFRRVNIRP